MEAWKDIDGFNGRYKVSDQGRIKSFAKENEGKIITPKKDTDGYLMIYLHKAPRQKKTYKVHRLVASAFHANPENHPHVNHKDCNKTNNTTINLEWCSHSYNTQHAIANGKHVFSLGTKHINAKLNDEAVRHIRQRVMRNKDYASLYNVTPSAISGIQRRPNAWRHVSEDLG